MTAKYHISPTTGRPNKCSATTKPCPYGDAEEHYPSKEAAREAYEAHMGKITNTLEGMRKERSRDAVRVVSLAEHKKAKATAAADALADARADTDFDAGLEDFPKYLLTKADAATLQAVADGKVVSDEKLDQFLDANRKMATEDGYNRPRDVAAARKVFAYLTAVREQRGTPSTLATIDSFDPSTHTLFSNGTARAEAMVMGKAIRKADAHREWMETRAAEERKSAEWAREDGDEVGVATALQAAANAEEEALRTEARVAAQLRELQYLFDTDEKFAATAPADVRRLLATGSWRGASGKYSGVPIGTVRPVK